MNWFPYDNGLHYERVKYGSQANLLKLRNGPQRRKDNRMNWAKIGKQEESKIL